MSEHENMPREDEQSEREETVEDLDVPEGQRDDVAGGRNKYPDIELKK